MQVYRIFNKKDNKCYIGITLWTFEERYSKGKWWKWTKNKLLKEAVKEYGLENFSYEILWEGEVPGETLDQLEIFYINKYDAFGKNGYNLIKGGSSPDRFYKEYKLIDYLGNIHKVFGLRKFCKDKKLNYNAMLNMVSKITLSSQGFALEGTDIKDINNPNKNWKLINIVTKERSTIVKGNVVQWCKERGFIINRIWKLLEGRVKVTYDWKLADTIIDSSYCGWRPNSIQNQKPKPRKYLGRQANFISPDGTKVKVDNISLFCRENNLKKSSVFRLLNSKDDGSYKGWKLNK